MKKIYLFLLVALIGTMNGFGQSTYYTFFQQTGTTYTPVTSGGSLMAVTWDDATTTFTMPFAFNIFGTSFSSGATVLASPNGYIEFGGTTNYTYTPNTVATSGIFTIGCMSQDLYSATSAITKTVVGSSPNRKLYINWQNCNHYSSGPAWNWQIVLYETSNIIEFQFGSFSSTFYSSAVAHTGIWGTSGTANNWQCRAVATGGAYTSSTNGARAAVCSQVSTNPPSGLVWTYCPSAAIPTSVSSSPASGCTPVSLTGSASLSSGVLTYTWLPATGLSSTTGTSTTATPTSNTIYTFTASNNGSGCAATATSTANVTPAVISGSTAVCTGRTITLTESTTGGSWSSSATGTATVTSGGVVTGVSAGTVNISYVMGSGCYAFKTITVSTTPSVSVSPTSAIFCSAGSPVGLTASGATTYTWAAAAGLSATTGASVNASPTSSRTYTVTGTTGSCSATATSAITYNVSTAAIIPFDTVICQPGLSPMIETGTGGTWSSSNTSVFTVDAGGIVYAVGAGSATVTYSNATCGTATQNLSVITGGFTMSMSPSSATYCSSGSPVAISVASGTADTFLWVPSYGLSDTVHSSANASPGASVVYTVYGTNSATGCHAQATVSITNNTPVAIAGGVTNICVSGAVNTTTWTDATSGGTWSSSATGVATVDATTGVITGVTAGSATITYTVTATGCYVTRGITVNALPSISVTPNAAASCAGVGVIMAASGGSSYTWLPTTGLSATTGGTVTATPGSVTVYTVTGTSAVGCVATATNSVGVGLGGYSIVPAATPTSVCPGSTTALSSSSPAYTVTGVTYSLITQTSPTTLTWSNTDDQVQAVTIPFTFNFFGTGYTSVNICTNGWVNFGTAGSATNYGGFAMSNTSEPLNAIAIFHRDMNVSGATGGAVLTSVEGTTPNRKFVIKYNNICTYGATAGGWTGEVVLYETANVIDVILASTVATSATVAAIQNSAGSVGYAGTGRNLISSAVSNETWRFAPPPASPIYSWSPSAGVATSTAASSSATVSATTIYTLTLSDATGCYATGTTTVTAYTLPTVAISPSIVCVGSNMTASGASTYSWSPATSLSATTGATVVPTPTVAVTYTVTGTDVHGCLGTASTTVNLPPSISVSPTAGCAPQALTASGGLSYSWSPSTALSATTGSGVTANPTSSAVVYTVTGTDAVGCTGTATANVGPAPSSITGTTSVCVTLTTALGNSVSGGSWSSSATSIASVDATTGVVTGVSAGTCDITYTVGTCSPVTTTVTVLTSPALSVTATGCAPSASLTASGATTYSWAPATGLSATTGASVSASPSTVTTYTVTGSNGTCAVDQTSIVYPTVASITGTTTVCQGSSTTLSDATAGGTWSSSATSVATVDASTGVVTGVSGGTSTITYGYAACTGTQATTTYTVNSLPSTTYTGSSNCTSPGVGITLSYAGGGGTYAWSPATYLSATTGASVTCTPTASITYTIVATGAGGCTSTVTLPIQAITSSPEAPTATPSSTCSGGTSTLVATVPYSGYSVASVTYSFVTQTSPAAGPAGDDVSSTATIPFTFNYYGTNYTSISMCTNGFCQFGGSATSYPAATFPSTAIPGAIALFWADDWMGTPGAITYSTEGTTPNRKFVIRYQGCSPCCSYVGGLDGEIILYETSNIIDILVSSQTNTANHTCGINNLSGTAAVCPSGRNNAAYTITTPEAWRFTPVSFAYSWSPATSLSATTGTSVSLTSAPGAGTYSVTATDAGTGCFFTGTTTVSVGPMSVGVTNPPTVCSGSPGTWTLTGPSGATVYYNINGGSTTSVTLSGTTGTVTQTISATTTLNLVSVTSGSCSNSLTGSNTIVPYCVCTPVWYYGTGYGYGCTDGMVVATTGYPFLLNGASGSINDATACTASGYEDMTSAGSGYTCTMNAGSSYTCTLGANTSAYSMSDQVWIDFNDDGTFQSSESVGGAGSWTSVRYSFVITIPPGTTAGINPGSHRMRVESEYYYHVYPSLLACPASSGTSSYYGDVRDYQITIAVPPVYTLSPTTIPFSPTTTGTSTAAVTASFSGNFLVPASGNFTVTAPSGFDISANGTTWLSSYTISYTGGTLSSTPIYVRFSPSSAIAYSGNVTITGGGITGANIAVTGTGATACSGTPTAGTAAVSPASGNATTPFTLTVSGYSVLGGIVFQWQSTSDTTTSWSNISGATLSSFSFTGVTSSTYYRCMVTCSYTSSSINTYATKATFLPSPTCTPTAGSWTSEGSYSYGVNNISITGFSGSNLSDAGLTSTPLISTTTGYVARYGTVATFNLQQNGVYATSVTWGTVSSYQEAQVWVDFNNDGTFQSSEEVSGVVGFSTSATTSPTTFNITIPLTAATGIHLMRVRGDWESIATTLGSAPAHLDPCLINYAGSNPSAYSGSIADYYVNIVALPPCSGTPTAGTAVGTTTDGCSGFSTTLSLSGATSASGMTFQWESSPNGSTWSTVAGATNPTYATTVTSATILYHCVVTCTASTLSGTSSAVTLHASSAISGSVNVCQSATTTLSDALSGGTWSSSATGVATVDATTGVVGGVAAGAVTISYATTGCTQTFGMNVIGVPASITGTTSVCNSFSTTLANSVTGGTWSSSNTAIATVDASTGVVTGTGVGSATISYSTGCGSAATASYTVNTQPSAIIGLATICTLSTYTMTDAASGGTWTLSSTTPGTIGSSSGLFSSSSTSGSTTITYTIGSCYVTAGMVVGTTGPAAIGGTASACVGATSTLTDATGGGSWTSSNTSVATVGGTTGIVTGVANGTVTITYSTGCPSDRTQSFTVNGTATNLTYSSGTLSSPAAVCSGGTLSLNSGTTSGGTYSWTGPNSFSSASQNPTISSVTPAASGTYTFTATVGGCSSGTQYVFVAVDAIPSVTVTASPTAICAGGTSTLTDAVTAPATGSYVVNAIPYNFVTLTSPVAGPAGDEVYSTIALPFTFNFYGTNYSSLNLSANGFLSFTVAAAGPYTNTALPSSSAPLAMVALSDHDLNTASGGSISYQFFGSAPNRKMVIYYNGVAAYSGTGSVTGEIILYETTNAIDLLVSNMNPAASDATGWTMGIQNQSGSSATTVPNVNHSTTPIGQNQAWRIAMPSYTYSWTPSTALSTTTAATTVSTGLTSTQIYTVTTIDAYSGCTTGNVSPVTLTVNPMPIVYAVTGGTGCSSPGVSLGVANSETGTTYNAYSAAGSAGSASGSTGSPVTIGTITTAGTYIVTATSAAGCSDTMSGSATVNTTPTATLGGNPSVCQPISSATITYSGLTGSPTTYNITWGSGAISDGFSNVSGGTLTGGAISLVIPNTSVHGIYTGTITVSNGSCTSASYSFTLTVYAYPTASITSSTAPCMGYSTSIVFTGTSGANISYTIDGGSAIAATLTGGTYSLGSGAMTSAHTYVLVNAYNPACTTTLGTSATVTPVPMQWTGTSSSDWNTAANWSCGFVPGSSDDATIPSGTPNAPVIAASASGTTRNLIIASGVTVTANSSATLNVMGNLTNNGSVTGAGTLSLDGSSAQTVNGFGSVKNLDVNNTAGVTVSSGSLVTVKSVLSVTSGSLATGDSVVLYSDTFGSARVAVLPSGTSITGNVKVNQFFTGGRRAYRFWAHPFNAYIGLSQLENYVDIAGPGGATNGFTTTGSNQPSAYWYNTMVGNSTLPADPGWKPFTSAYTTADSNRFHQYQGIRVYYRGAKGEGLGFGPYIVISSTTSSQWGVLNQGNQNITLSKGSGTGQDYNMVGNPYASPVDIGTVIFNAAAAGRITGTAFYVWNPFLNTAGGFQAIPYATTGGTPVAVPYYLQANDAFQVRAAANSVALNFTESNKGATITSAVSLMKTHTEFVSLYVYDANYHPYDMLYVRFDDEASAEEDSKFDAGKPTGQDFNFYSLSADNHKLMIDARPYKAENVIPLGVVSNYAQDYIIRAENLAVPEGGAVYLHDKLLKQYVLLNAGTEYRFTVTKDDNTQGENRFELSMEPGTVKTTAKGLDVKVTPNPATDDVKISFTQGSATNVNVRVLDLSGVSVYNQALGMKQNGSITVPLSNMASGIYMVELTADNQKVVQRLIKE